MPLVKIAATAQEDLKKIWAYVGRDNSEAAEKLIKEITFRFGTLRDHPHMGRAQDDLLVSLRSFAVKNHVIFYRPFEEGIEILRVLHGARDIGSILESFFDSL
jgi:toxin ParE1/3/4